MQAKAAARVAEQEARLAFGRLTDHSVPVEDPFTALNELAGDVVAWKEFCAGRIEALESIRTVDLKGTEQVHALIQLWERAMERCVTTLATIAKLDIDSRLARISEKHAETVQRAVDAGIAAAKVLNPEQAGALRTAVARELRRAG